jgi:hypothetical protein
LSKREKLVRRFLSKPADFSYSELSTLLGAFGYEEIATGRTAGSRVAFLNRQTLHVIRLHRPHPTNLLKRYQLDLVEDELRNQGAIP